MFDKIYFGPFSISTYTFLLDIGILGTLAWLWWRAKNYGRDSSRWLDAGISVVAGAIIGGRFAFAFSNWAYFQNHLLEMFRFWEGGYEWFGAALGGVIALAIFCFMRGESFVIILEELALPSLCLFALHWIGCAASACAAGLAVPPGALPFAMNLPDLYGVTLPRWPAQYIGLALTLIAIGYLISQRNKNFPGGFRFALAVTLIAVISFMVSTVRGDDMQKLGTWRLDTVINIVMILLGGCVLIAVWFLTPVKSLTAEKGGERRDE